MVGLRIARGDEGRIRIADRILSPEIERDSWASQATTGATASGGIGGVGFRIQHCATVVAFGSVTRYCRLYLEGEPWCLHQLNA